MKPLYQETQNLFLALVIASLCWGALSVVLVLYAEARRRRRWAGGAVLVVALSAVAWLPFPINVLWIFPAVTLAVTWGAAATLRWWGRARDWGFLPVALCLLAICYLSLKGMVGAVQGVHLTDDGRIFFMHGINGLSWPVLTLLDKAVGPKQLALALTVQVAAVRTVLDHFVFLLAVGSLGAGFALVRTMQPPATERITIPRLPRWYVPVCCGLWIASLIARQSLGADDPRMRDVQTVLACLAAPVALQGAVMLWRLLPRQRGLLVATGGASLFLPGLAALLWLAGAADAVLSLQPLLRRAATEPPRRTRRARWWLGVLVSVLPLGLLGLLLLYSSLFIPRQLLPNLPRKNRKHQPAKDTAYKVVARTDTMVLVRGAALQFWMDRYEFPNRRGQRPLLTTRIETARARCREQAKQLCTWRQWRAMCVADPFRVGNRPRDRSRRLPDSRSWEATYKRCHVNRPGAGVLPAGARTGCQVAGGPFDLLGNAWELIDVEGPPGLVAIAGGSFRSRSEDIFECATPFFLTHGQLRRISRRDVGFRCCKPVAPKEPVTPK